MAVPHHNETASSDQPVHPNTTHGNNRRGRRTLEYQTWLHIKRRCFNQRSKNYKDYGGRGITVCEEWKDDFTAFLAHVGPRPSPRHTIDRIDNDGNYEPGNVKWSTRVEQCRNRRSSRLIEFRGETKTLAEWAEVTGLRAVCILHRIERGWSIEDAMTKPLDVRGGNGARVLVFQGREMALTQWARELKMSVPVLRYRLSVGWTMEQIISTPVHPHRSKAKDSTRET